MDDKTSYTEIAKQTEQTYSPESPDNLSTETSEEEENITSVDRLLAIANKIESTANLIHQFTLRIEHHIDNLENVFQKLNKNKEFLSHSCFQQNLNRISVNANNIDKMSLISNYFAATMADNEGKSYSKCTLKDFQSYFKIMRLFNKRI